ncbi:MAG: beta strand repeat-containing protein, partial [Planctomycetaceae bacterium]
MSFTPRAFPVRRSHFRGRRRGRSDGAAVGSSRSCDRLAPEQLEGRALLAVTAGIVDGDLLIDYGNAADVLAEIVSNGTNYTVSGTGLSATPFSLASVTGRIMVTAGAGIDGQTFRVLAGTPLANPLQVTAAIETTNLIAGINVNATRPGDVIIESGTVTIGSGFSEAIVPVSTAATNGNVTFSQTVTLNYDTAFTSGFGAITLGIVGTPGGAGLFLGNTDQSGAVRLTGNVELPSGLMVVAPGAFNLALEGETNRISSAEIQNTGVLRIGRDGGTSEFTNGLQANSQSAVSLAGVIETVNMPLILGAGTLLAATTHRSGSGRIQTGAVTDGASAFTLALGSTTQTGDITLGGNVTLDGLTTAAGDFAVSLLGSANDIAGQVTFTNTKYVVFGDDTNDASRFAAGVTATSQTAANVVIGTVRTAGNAIDLRSAYLAGLATLDTSDAGANASGGLITLRNGAQLESHVLTTIGGVGQAASATQLLGTGAFGSNDTGSGSLVVQTGPLLMGVDASNTTSLTIAHDTTIQVTADSLTIGAGSTIDASGKVLTLLADDVAIASAAGSIDTSRISVVPVTAGRGVFLGTATGAGLVLGTTELQAIDADTIQIGRTDYSGRVTIGTLALADTRLAIVADGTGGGVTLDGTFTSTGTPTGRTALHITGSGTGTVLNANITSTGDVFIDDALELAAATVTINTSGAGADVYLTGGTAGIWSSKDEANNLVVTAGVGSATLATRAGFNDHGGQAGLVRNVTATGGTVLLGGGNKISGGLSLGAPHVTLGAVVRAAGSIVIHDGAGSDAAIVIVSNTILDATQDGEAAAGNPVTIRGTVTALEANNYSFSLKGGTDGDVLVTGKIGFVGSGAALGTVTITGNDVTVAAIDGLSGGLFLEAVDAVNGVDPGSVTLTGTTYKSTSALGISAGTRSAFERNPILSAAQFVRGGAGTRRDAESRRGLAGCAGKRD